MRSITAQSASSVIGSGFWAARSSVPRPRTEFLLLFLHSQGATDPGVDGFGSCEGSAKLSQKGVGNVANAYGVRITASVEGLFLAAASFSGVLGLK